MDEEVDDQATNEIAGKPCLVARFVHAKSDDGNHGIVECTRTNDGLAGKRPATYEMKSSSYNTQYVGEAVRDEYCGDYEWVAAIRNRRTGDAIFTPFDLVHFRPKIQMSEEMNVTTKIDANNYEEIRNRLIMEFGHKKQKQMLTSSLRNALDEKATGQLFSHAMTHMKMNEEEKRAKLEDAQEGDDASVASGSSPSVQISSVLPPCNLQAKQPSEIYNIADIMSEEILNAMKPEAENVMLLTPKELQEAGHPSLVLAIIQMSSSMKDAQERTKRVAYSLYLGYLIRLNRLIGGRIRLISPSALTESCSMPQAVLEDLLWKFTSVGSAGEQRSWSSVSKLSISTMHKDILLSNVAVLLLILSGQFAFNLNKAAKDLGVSDGKVTVAKLSAICRALGCKLDKHPQTGEQICILQQPPKQKNALLKKQALGGMARGGRR